MKKLAVGTLLATALVPVVGSCNSDSTTEYELSSSALVRSFSLASNDSILANLDSVFFSIDLYTGQIYNADSLPFGTRIQALTPTILTDGASVIELSVPRPGRADTVINYLSNTTDTVNFSNGPVGLRVVSLDGKTEYKYSIKVNVHTVPTDTLTWSRPANRGNLPSAFSMVNAQHTTMSPSGTYYCMTSYQGEYSIAYTTNPDGTWTKSKVALGFTPDINSFTATTAALYILDNAGNLYTSTNNGTTWTSTGNRADNILGAYTNRLITTVKDGSQWSIVEYPGAKKTAAPTNFPVQNASTAVSIKFDMASAEQLIVVGGRLANGELSNRTWGFDGNTWVDLTRGALPYKLENMALTPYYSLGTDSASWRLDRRTSVMLAFCGNNAKGTPNDTVYMTRDFGMHWTKAPANLQLNTKAVPSRTLTQIYPYTTTVHAASRATAPITEWQVPYLYMFGGISAQGATYNTLFRGVITRFTFKPLQ